MFRRVAAAAVVVVLALLPVGFASPAQAAAAFGPNPCGTGSVTSLTANCANIPILVEAGLVSGAAGTTAATGATTSIAASSAIGTLGFSTVVGATGAAVGLGLLKLFGLDEGVTIQTDPGYAPPAGPSRCLSYTRSGAQTLAGVVGPIAVATAARCGDAVSLPGGWGFQLTTAPTSLWAPAVFTVTAVGTAAVSVRFAYVGSNDGWASSTYCNPSVTLQTSRTVGSTFSIPTTCEGNANSMVDWVFVVGATGTDMSWSNAGTVLGTKKVGVPTVAGYHGTVRTTLSCKNSAGTVHVIKTARVDVDQGKPIPVPPAACTPPSIASGVLVEYQADGTSIWTTIGTATTPGGVVDLPEVYPDCFTTSTVVKCYLDLQIRRSTGTGWESCGPLASYCPDWVQDFEEAPAIYRCRYGNYTVSIDLCSAFRKPGTLSPNHVSPEDDPHGEPVPVPPTAPLPTTPPNPVVDPVTGEKVDLGEFIDTDGSTSTQENARECFPTGWGILNPVSWIIQPLRCVFEPRQSRLDASVAQVRNSWSRTAPVKLIAAASAWEFLPPPSGCDGILIDVWFLGPPFRIMQACPGDMLADMAMWSRIFGVVVMSVYGVIAVSRHIGRIIGYGGLGSGGDDE